MRENQSQLARSNRCASVSIPYWDLNGPSKMLSEILRRSFGLSRLSVKPGFSQIDITLDSAQGLVADYFVIAQSNYGLAFCFQGLAR